MKKVKILTIILTILLVTAISFFGIYEQNQGRMVNKIKDYSYGMDLEGYRYVKFSLNSENKTTIKDSEGKVVEYTEDLTDEQITEKGYTKEETPYNSDEDKNTDNYKKAKEIIEERLKKLRVEQYNIKLDEENGDIILELPENDETTDEIISNSGTTGKFEIIDTDTNEVLMTNNDIETAKVLYGSSSQTSTGTTVYLDIEFNKEGSKKLEDISNTYVKTENTTSEENSEEQTSEENKEADETTSTEEKTITMKIDDQEIMSTSFEEPLKTGKLQLSVGAASTDEETLQGNINRASNMANLLDTGNLPLKYDLDENEYILANINNDKVQTAKYIVLAVFACALVWLVIKYKSKGIFGAISFIGFISVLLLLIRYTNVILSIEGILAIALIGILNYLFVNKLLANTSIKEEYKKFSIKLIPISVFVIVCCFIRWLPISSFGMVMFWGIVLIEIYNALITNNLIKFMDAKEHK